MTCRSVCLSVCREGVHCTVAKRLIVSRCGLGGELGRSRDGYVRRDGDRLRERVVLGVNVGHPIVTGDFVA